MQRTKFILGGLLILAAVVYLIVSSTQANAEYFMTIDELKAEGSAAVGKSLRASGAVIGDTIQYDPQTLTLSFEVAHVPGDNADIEAQGGLAVALHEATYAGHLCWTETRLAARRGPGHYDRSYGRRRYLLRG